MSACVQSYVSFLCQDWHTRAERTNLWMRSKDLGHLFCPFLLFPLPLSPPTHWIPFPSLIPLSHALTLFCLSPQIGPAVHQPPHSSPSCLPSPNEKPHNNTGHRSRERTGCTHNGPVAPSKTIVPFFSSGLSALLPGLEKTNLWRGSWRGGKPSWTTASQSHSPPYNCLKDHNDKHTCTHQHLLSPLHPCPLPPRHLFIWRVIMSFNTLIKVKTETLSSAEWYKCVREPCHLELIWKLVLEHCTFYCLLAEI